MKLHLPARLRSALLACLAVVAPLAGTVATGTFVGGAVVASLSLTEAQAAEVEVAAGTTVTYDASNTYVLKGGTLKVESGAVSSAITIAAAESSISLGAGATLSPLRVTLAEGVQSYKLVGTGTYDLASATQMYGANASSSDWKGTVSISNSTGVGDFNFNHYGNADSTVKISGVSGWMARGPYTPTILLEDNADSSALNVTAASESFNYTFAKILGNGTFERGGTTSSGRATFRFYGDVSGWKGNILNNFGQTTLEFGGAATEINLAGITHNAGYDMDLKFIGSVATTVNSPIVSTAGGAINMTVGNAGGVTFNKSVGVTTLTANGAVTVGASGTMTVSGAATLAAPTTVYGTLSLNGGVTMSSSITNNGTLNITGAIVVNSAGLDRAPTGDSTFSDGDNGRIESGSLVYSVIKNATGATLNTQGTTLSFDGDNSLKLSDSGTVTREADTSSTEYWVNKGDVSYAATNAESYRMNGGTLVLDKTGAAAAQGTVLVDAVGGNGTVKLTQNASITGGVATQSTADLLITNGATLSVGDGKNSANYAGSFSSVTLDNGKLSINALPGEIQNLTVTENNGEISFPDFVNSPTAANAYVFSGVTQLDGQLVVKGSYKFVARFAQLKGAGSFEFNGPTSGENLTQVLVDSLQDFTGNLSFVQNNGSNPYYKVTLNSGKADVSMTSLTVGKGAAKPGNQNNIDMFLTVGGEMALSGALTMQSNAALSIAGAAGLKLNGGLIVQGADNSITVQGDSALDLSKLVVTDGAALSLSGKYSALAMNQSGTVTLSGMTLTDGASLVYGAGTSTLRVEQANLGASVKVDLNNLTDAQALAIANGSGLNLGIDSQYAHSEADKTITVVSDYVRDAKLEVVGDSWKLTSGVVSMYWEAETGTGSWDSTNYSNWSFKDEAESNKRTFVAGTDAIFSKDANAEVLITSAPDVKNIEVTEGQYTFMTAFEGDLSVGNDLIVGKDSAATFEKGTGVTSPQGLLVAGDVSVAQGGVLNVKLDSMEVSGALKGTGGISVESDLSLGKSSSIGQLVVDGKVTMTGTNTAEERFTDLTVGGSSSVNGLENVGKLTVNKDGSLNIGSGTTVESLAGDGILEASGDVTLTSGTSSIGKLASSSVSMGKNVTLDVDTLQTSEVTMTLGSDAVSGTTLLTAGSTVGDTKVALAVDKVDDLSKLTNGSVLTLATIGTPGGDVEGGLIAPVLTPEEAATTDLVVKSDTEFSVTKDLRGFGYTLKVSDDGKTVTLVTDRDNKGWIGSESDTWTQNSQSGWEVGYIPNPIDRAAGFFGEGSSEVKIDTAGVQAALIDVDIAQGKLQEISSYKFVGGNVTADNMYIGQGELIIANRTEINQDTKVYSNGKLTVAEGGHLESYGNLSLTDDVTLTLDTDAVLTVSGSLSSEEDVTITNSGMLSAHDVNIAGSMVNEGTLQIAAGGSIGSIEGGTLRAVVDAVGTLKMGSANVSVLQIGTTGSKVELSEDSVIGTLYSTVEGTSLTSTAKLTLSEAAANQGGVVSVTAQALTLNKVGNEFGTLNVPVITLDLKGSALSADVAAISVESIVAVDPVQILLSPSVIDNLPVDADNMLVSDDYLLIKGVGGYSVGDFIIADSIMQEIKRRGVTAEVLLKDDNLLLSLGAIDGGMIWDTANGNMETNNGYEIPDGEGLYKALDYIEQVIVSDNKTIDLTAAGVGNAVAGNASIPAAGLMVRNPDGGGKLTIVGDAADSNGSLPDVVTIIGNREIESPVALVGESVKVNIGLPEGSEGILTDDTESSEVILASAEMSEKAVLQVNEDATVKGQVDLTEGASLEVTADKVINVLQLNGDASAIVSGQVDVNGVGGSYEGAYGASGAKIAILQGGYQSVKAGSGLSLVVNGGEGTLDLAGADAEMVGLAVGSAARASRSEMVIANVTMDDDAHKVRHHKLSLTGDDSFISGSEVTASLGAEETAVTLGTAAAPVIMDGKVDINNSTICLTMVTTNDNLRSLDVNTDAPMAGAKLATLVTEGNISADNEVQLIGTRAMMNVINKYYTNARLDANGDILVDRVTDYYATKASGLSETGTIGMDMLDKVLVSLNPQSNAKEYTDLAEVLNALDDAVVAGDTAAADDIASAVTGASAAAMGAALAGDMERQLRAIRNRTTTMGVDQGIVNHNMPYFNAWINAEVDNRTLDQDGTLSGYDYTVSGGTVGFDVDVTPRFVCGLAISALTGDVSSEGPDKLDADVDSYYLTAFARTTYRRWTHTFVASVGKSDLSMDRTVSYAGGSYTAKGETEATSFGAMYELGYVFALDVDGTTCLQPVFNVSFVQSSMDGYTESGSDASLDVGSVDMTAITIGMGARLQSVVGQNVFNRSSIFESRALVKVNAGDRDAEVDTNLLALPSAGGKVSSAERGPISLELGAGISIPVGAKSGSIFLDGSAELGSEYTGLNATVGYRLNF